MLPMLLPLTMQNPKSLFRMSLGDWIQQHSSGAQGTQEDR